MRLSQESLDIPDILRKYGLRPNKKLGQNFLIDQSSLQNVIFAAQINPADTILEIGPGLGSLTRLLAQQAFRVVAVEVDAGFIPILNDILAQYPNVEIIHGDILKLDPARLVPGSGYLVVANIPYYITSSIIRHLLDTKCLPRRLALTVQLEVANRICALPGDMSLLALSVQVFGKPTIAAHIPAQAFYPPPVVDSAVVCVEIFPEPLVPPTQIDLFFRLAKAGFSQKRKTLRNSISGGMGWSKVKTEQLLLSSGIDPLRRAETLSLEEWQMLVISSDVKS
ncbi:MAG: ribosomal RNA small subunit methyltransferase A [Chloroflexi bacterium RBG_16_54_18]|nr:MAG: ribosomal RNA small subunit methyltransferase A [Chloroflexi bacterium RBG_16_54_18]